MKLNLLSDGKLNHKIGKNNETEYFYIWSLNLKPAVTEVNGKNYDLCPFRTAGCTKICVGNNGHFSMKNGSAYKAQVRKTTLYFSDTAEFFNQLFADIEKCKKYADKKGLKAVFRLNAYSDQNWHKQSKRYMGISIYEKFADCIFYDYTKDTKKALENNHNNYFITVSYNEHMTFDKVTELVNKGHNVAMVFETLPSTFLGLPVFDGDVSDNRFTDPKGHIIGLKFKGSKKKLLQAIADGFCIPNVMAQTKAA